MMNKKYIAAVAGIVIFLSGCEQHTEMPPNTTEETVIDTAAATEESLETWAESHKNGYYGDWLVTSVMGTSLVYALSEEEIDEMIDTTLTYQPGSYVMNGNTMAVQGYEEENMTKEVFELDFGVALSDFDVSNDEIKSVMMTAEGNFFGGYFYVLGEDTLMVYYEGVFFKAERQ